jgi:hypothetical protein
MAVNTYSPAIERDRWPPTLYTPAVEEDEVPSASGVVYPAVEDDYAPMLIAPILPSAIEFEEALPLFRRGGPVPELIVMCGCGFKYATGAPQKDGSYEHIIKELIPVYQGIAVTEGLLYGFSVNIKMMDINATVQAGMMWFRSPGQVADQIGMVESDPFPPDDNEWYPYTVQGFPPVDPAPGAFMIPYVRIIDTFADIPFYMAGAQVYVMGETGTVSAYAPDLYLTLGDAGELLGVDEEQGGGFFIGNPQEKR